jgi:hypothetical protein
MSYAIEFDAVEGPVRSATYTNPQEKLSTVDKTNQCSLRRISNVAKITIDRTEIEIIALAVLWTIFRKNFTEKPKTTHCQVSAGRICALIEL